MSIYFSFNGHPLRDIILKYVNQITRHNLSLETYLADFILEHGPIAPSGKRDLGSLLEAIKRGRIELMSDAVPLAPIKVWCDGKPATVEAVAEAMKWAAEQFQLEEKSRDHLT